MMCHHHSSSVWIISIKYFSTIFCEHYIKVSTLKFKVWKYNFENSIFIAQTFGILTMFKSIPVTCSEDINKIEKIFEDLRAKLFI